MLLSGGVALGGVSERLETLLVLPKRGEVEKRRAVEKLAHGHSPALGQHSGATGSSNQGAFNSVRGHSKG